MSIASMMLSNHLNSLPPLLLLPSIFPSIRVFSNESALCIRWPKYWSFSFSISPANEYSRLISFRMDWLALLAVQGALKSLPQCHCVWMCVCVCIYIYIYIQTRIQTHTHLCTHIYILSPKIKRSQCIFSLSSASNHSILMFFSCDIHV